MYINHTHFSTPQIEPKRRHTLCILLLLVLRVSWDVVVVVPCLPSTPRDRARRRRHRHRTEAIDLRRIRRLCHDHGQTTDETIDLTEDDVAFEFRAEQAEGMRHGMQEKLLAGCERCVEGVGEEDLLSGTSIDTHIDGYTDRYVE